MDAERKESRDKRALPRNNFIHNFQVYNRDTGEPIGDLADITLKGTLLISSELLETNVTYRVEVDTDDLPDSQHIQFDAKCIRCFPTVHEGLYSAAFQITDIDAPNSEILQKMITEYGLDCEELL